MLVSRRLLASSTTAKASNRLRAVWPEPVERIAVFLRAAGVEGRLEELLPGAGPPAGQKLRADGFEGEGAVVVALVPAGRSVDDVKLAVAAGFSAVRPAPAPGFPFEGARVFMDQSILSADAAWLEAGSPRHVLELSPVQIARVTKARTAELLREN
jgi:prolyl-tRNA editing enzyme YbaK/EbsC (Cys-tRNA(Pro) deacylase)